MYCIKSYDPCIVQLMQKMFEKNPLAASNTCIHTHTLQAGSPAASPIKMQCAGIDPFLYVCNSLGERNRRGGGER